MGRSTAVSVAFAALCAFTAISCGGHHGRPKLPPPEYEEPDAEASASPGATPAGAEEPR